jgi:uncharacterized protein
MAEHPHIGIVRRAMRAASAGDMAELQQLFTRDCVVHMPGGHSLAGEHKGLDATLDLVRRMREGTGETMRVEPQQLFADGRGHVIGLYRFTADRKGHRRDMVSATICTIVGDRIAGAEGFEQDLDQLDGFWA